MADKKTKPPLQKWYHELEFDDMQKIRRIEEGWQIIVNLRGDQVDSVVLINPDNPKEEHVKVGMQPFAPRRVRR